MKEYLESPLKDKITPEKLYFSRRKFLRLSGDDRGDRSTGCMRRDFFGKSNAWKRRNPDCH